MSEKPVSYGTMHVPDDPRDAEIERLRAENENLPCGHRKRDMDDSYGGCMFCQAMASINSDDDEAERLEAEIELLQAKLALIERITSRLSSDREYSGGEAADEIQEVLDGRQHQGAWYEPTKDPQSWQGEPGAPGWCKFCGEHRSLHREGHLPDCPQGRPATEKERGNE